MKAIPPSALLALALLAGSRLTACESPGSKPVADGTTYSLGHLDVMVSADPKRIVEAAESVFLEMDIAVESSAASGIDGQVVGKTAQGKRIDITVERQDAERSKYSILVGSFGDEKVSREIHERLKARL